MVCNTLCQTGGQPTEFCEAPPSCTHTSQPGKSAKDDQVAADNSDKSPELDTSLLAWLTFPPRYIGKNESACLFARWAPKHDHTGVTYSDTYLDTLGLDQALLLVSPTHEPNPLTGVGGS